MSIKKNSIINFIGAAVPLLLTLFTLPLYVQTIGEERFAVVSIAWIILGYFGFFDLGLSQATASAVAKTGDQYLSQRGEIYWTALTINGFFGLIGGALAWVAGYVFFRDYFATSVDLKSEILGVLPWLAIAVPIATISGVQIGCLQGREKFIAINKISIAGSFLLQLLPLAAAITISPRLNVIMPVTVLSRVVVLILLGASVNKDFQIARRPIFKKKLAKELLNFGGWVTVSGIISPILTTFDRFIIGAIAGAKSVTYYTVPYNLASRVSIFPTSLTTALFPRLSGANSLDRRVYAKNAIAALILIMLPLLAFGILNFNAFLKIWMSLEFSRKSSGIGEVILLGMFFNSLARIPYVSLQASGRPDLVAKCHLVEVIPYCLILYFATIHFGAIGAAAAWTLRSCVDAILLFFFHGIEKRNLLNAIAASAFLFGLTLYSIFKSESTIAEEVGLNAFLIAPLLLWSGLMIRKIRRD